MITLRTSYDIYPDVRAFDEDDARRRIDAFEKVLGEGGSAKGDSTRMIVHFAIEADDEQAAKLAGHDLLTEAFRVSGLEGYFMTVDPLEVA